VAEPNQLKQMADCFEHKIYSHAKPPKRNGLLFGYNERNAHEGFFDRINRIDGIDLLASSLSILLILSKNGGLCVFVVQNPP
jgi:hypothetical protein